MPNMCRNCGIVIPFMPASTEEGLTRGEALVMCDTLAMYTESDYDRDLQLRFCLRKGSLTLSFSGRQQHLIGYMQKRSSFS